MNSYRAVCAKRTTALAFREREGDTRSVGESTVDTTSPDGKKRDENSARRDAVFNVS